MLSAVELKKLSDELFNYFTVLSKEGSQIDHYLYEAVKHNLPDIAKMLILAGANIYRYVQTTSGEPKRIIEIVEKDKPLLKPLFDQHKERLNTLNPIDEATFTAYDDSFESIQTFLKSYASNRIADKNKQLVQKTENDAIDLIDLKTHAEKYNAKNQEEHLNGVIKLIHTLKDTSEKNHRTLFLNALQHTTEPALIALYQKASFKPSQTNKSMSLIVTPAEYQSILTFIVNFVNQFIDEKTKRDKTDHDAKIHSESMLWNELIKAIDEPTHLPETEKRKQLIQIIRKHTPQNIERLLCDTIEANQPSFLSLCLQHQLTSNKNGLFVFAVSAGHPGCVSLLLNQCININELIISERDATGKPKLSYTPLMIAASSGNLTILKFLLRHGANLSRMDHEETDLLTNLEQQKKQMSSILRSLSHETARSSRAEYTPAPQPVLKKDYRLLDKCYPHLIEYHTQRTADIDHWENTRQVQAIFDQFQIFLSDSIKNDEHFLNDFLLLSVTLNYPTLSKLMIQWGANIHSLQRGDSPLMKAIRNKHYAILHILVSNHKPSDDFSRQSHTHALNFAIYNKDHTAASILSHQDTPEITKIKKSVHFQYFNLIHQELDLKSTLKPKIS